MNAINRQSFIEAVAAALRAERNGEQFMDPGIAAYRIRTSDGDEVVFRYESGLTNSSGCFKFWNWDAAQWGIHDRVVDMNDDQIHEVAEATFDVFEDEILDEIISYS